MIPPVRVKGTIWKEEIGPTAAYKMVKCMNAQY